MPYDAVPDRHPGFPARAVLRPGTRVCRRSATELQVGLAPERAIVLPDDPAVRLVLRGLADGRPPAAPTALAPAARLAAEKLLAHELVVDADLWCRAIDGVTGEAARSRSAVVADAGACAAARLAARSAIGVAVHDEGLPRAAAAVDDLLASVGIRRSSLPRADAVVVLADHEPRRSLLDELVRDDRPHLLLTVVEGRVAVGPFVQPGVTACQRCIDAHQAESDPRRSLVVEQYSTPAAEVWGLPAPVPVDLVDLAAAFVVRDLTRWADVLEPATWSTTIAIDPGLTLPRTQWSRHAACGCSSNAATA